MTRSVLNQTMRKDELWDVQKLSSICSFLYELKYLLQNWKVFRIDHSCESLNQYFVLKPENFFSHLWTVVQLQLTRVHKSSASLLLDAETTFLTRFFISFTGNIWVCKEKCWHRCSFQQLCSFVYYSVRILSFTQRFKLTAVMSSTAVVGTIPLFCKNSRFSFSLV